MKLIVGLGNPGKEYENTRHNSGFKVVDKLSASLNIDVNQSDFKGSFGRGSFNGEKIIIFKPMTYMNLSGTAVQEIVHYFKIDINDIIVCFDDMAIEPGQIRLRVKGSSGGQKGMQNIIDNLGTDNIKRIRIGIGEPTDNSIDHVLGKPYGEEKEAWESAINRAVKALEEIMSSTFEKAMSLFNK